jgi:hypothetical protein
MGAKERDRLFHHAAGVGDEPLTPRTGGERYLAAREAFSGVNLGTVEDELKGLYKLALDAADAREIARTAISLADSMACYRNPLYIKETIERLHALRARLED